MPENSLPTTTKADLRRQLLADRQAIPAEVRAAMDKVIGAHTIAWWNAHPAQVLGVYWPIRCEPDLRTTYGELASRGVQLALPMVVARDTPLQYACWRPGDPLVKDSMGVMVPEVVQAIQPDAVLVPCVGFNGGNVRLGYGGGFYDRTLAAKPRPLCVGIAYAASRCDFDSEEHDVALDDIITEQSPPGFAPLSL